MDNLQFCVGNIIKRVNILLLLQIAILHFNNQLFNYNLIEIKDVKYLDFTYNKGRV